LLLVNTDILHSNMEPSPIFIDKSQDVAKGKTFRQNKFTNIKIHCITILLGIIICVTGISLILSIITVHKQSMNNMEMMEKKVHMYSSYTSDLQMMFNMCHNDSTCIGIYIYTNVTMMRMYDPMMHKPVGTLVML